MDLAAALRLGKAPRLALVGAGGKTTALFQLARQLPPPVLVAATTHLAAHQVALADRHFRLDDPAQVERFAPQAQSGVTLFTGLDEVQQRLKGLEGAALQAVWALAETMQAPLLLEADGSRMLPLKAPAPHEPPIPGFVDTVVVAAGLSGLGQPLDPAWVHRPELFASLSGLEPGAPVSAAALGRLLTHPQGGLKNCPPGARRIALLNQADTPLRQAAGRSLARLLLADYAAVVIAALAPPQADLAGVAAVYEPVAGIILAAGGSQRFGRPKPLLDWQGEPFVRRVTRTALEAGLSPVVLVTGCQADSVAAAAAGLDVQVVDNPDWSAGQSASLRAGLAALPPEVGAAVFLLADQPQAPAALIEALAARHAETLAPLVAPLAGGRRANPVLFDRVTFADLAALQGDVGGRAVFSRYSIEYVPWLDERIALDVDTPQDYQRLLAAEGAG
jgi:molybdenum cofactor cytidylyltransferase